MSPARPGRAGDDESQRQVWGVRPVQEMLEARPREVERILVARQAQGTLGRVLRVARHAGVPVSHVPRELLDRRVAGRARHQGIVAVVAPVAYADPDEICRLAAERADGLVVLLDGVTDAGNLGAIARSAAAAGAQGLLLHTEGTAGVSGVALKASAGVLSRLPVAREPRMPARLRSLRERGFDAVLLDPRGDAAWDAAELGGRTALVVGGEERGARPGTARECNIRVAIPLGGGVESLNVSVAAGVVLFELVRRRRGAAGDP